MSVRRSTTAVPEGRWGGGPWRVGGETFGVGGRREGGQTLSARCRLGGDARHFSGRQGPSRFPAVARCIDRARRAVAVLSTEGCDRSFRRCRADREKRSQGRLY